MSTGDTMAVVSVFTLSDHSRLSGVACHGSGYYHTIRSNDTNQQLLYNFDRYFASKINITVPRFSAVYTDAFGLGRMVTGGLPVYNSDGYVDLGFYVDVPLSQISSVSNDTEDDINSQLMSNQRCENLDLNRKTDTCPQINIAQPYRKPSLVRHKDLIFGLSATAMILFAIIMSAWFFHRGKKALGVFWLMSIFAIMWFWLVYGLAIYDNQIQVTYWKSTQEYTTAKTVVPYECTQTVNCKCSNYYGQSCSGASRNLLEPESLEWNLQCQTGYHCCRYTTYCGSYSRRCSRSSGTYGCSGSCSTYCSYYVTRCISKVSRRSCQEIRGICNYVYVDVEYQVNNGLVQTTRVRNCGLNNTACVDQYLNSFPVVGEYRDVYYNPWNPEQVDSSIGYDAGQWFNMAIPIVYLTFLLCSSICSEYRTYNQRKASYVIKTSG